MSQRKLKGSSSSCNSTPKNRRNEVRGFSFSKMFFGQKRKLTRQHKTQYLSDEEPESSTRAAHGSAHSLPVSPVSDMCTSPCHRDLDHWSCSAVPQPLPLPKIYRREGPNGCDATREGVPLSSTFRSKFDGLAIKTTTRIATKSAEPLCSCSNMVTQNQNPCSNCKLKLDFISKSAPSSLAVSPRTSSTGDLLTSSYMSRSQVRSAFSLNSSPMLSPTAHSPKESIFDFHNRSFAETNALWPESRNVYQLPLPPKALGSRQLPNSPHFIQKKMSSPSIKRQWQKGKLIGRGTFGNVFVATNRETGALCAMKEVDIIPDDPKSAESIKQLEQEIDVLSQLKHPNIVQYYGSEMVDDIFRIYLEYIYPGSINKYMRQYYGAMTESVLRNFTRHILHGLAYLHSMNTIHRDIKGANLLVDSAGVVKLSDFGLAKHLNGEAYDLSLKGSPYWMAPEIIQSSMLNDANPDRAFAVDIWSLGCTVIEMMNGKPPWSELEPPAAMFNVLSQTPPIPDALSWEGKDFLRCCFIRNPKERPSAKTLLDHPFLRNLDEFNFPLSTFAFSEPKLMGKTPMKTTSPSACGPNKNASCYGETSPQCYAENSNTTLSCRHSPPTLKSPPARSFQQSNHSSYKPQFSNCSKHHGI